RGFPRRTAPHEGSGRIRLVSERVPQPHAERAVLTGQDDRRAKQDRAFGPCFILALPKRPKCWQEFAMPTAPKRAPEKLHIAAAGRRIPVVVRRNARARRLILRVDEAVGLPVLTLPRRATLDDGARFLRQNLGWLEEQLSGLTPSSPF